MLTRDVWGFRGGKFVDLALWFVLRRRVLADFRILSPLSSEWGNV
jgi:hypothetical protein